VDYKLELVLLPVSDVERAKAFYEALGFRLDVDHRVGDDFRVVQFTPPGSACSVSFGIGVTTDEPGSVHGLHLVVEDIAVARYELTKRGAEVSPIRHMTPEGWKDGVDPGRARYNSFAEFSDPDGNSWVLQEVPPAVEPIDLF
jgi:catechol 2,3-dioxygenase-like lactoylglutathione lyase family enzyme